MLDSKFEYMRVKKLIWNTPRAKTENADCLENADRLENYDYLESCDPLDIIAEAWKIGSPVPNFLVRKNPRETYRKVVAYLDKKRLGQAVIALASACKVPILNAEFIPFYCHSPESALAPIISTYFFSLSDVHLTLEAYGLTPPFRGFSREQLNLRQNSMVRDGIMGKIDTEEWAPFFSDLRECRVYERVLRHNTLELDKDAIFRRFIQALVAY